VCTRVLLLSIAYVRFTRPNKFFFVLLYTIHFYSPWREEKSNGWMKRSILISLRWLPLWLQNDLFIRSKRPMPFGQVYNIIIHNISIIRYIHLPCEIAYTSRVGRFVPTRSHFWNHVKYKTLGVFFCCSRYRYWGLILSFTGDFKHNQDHILLDSAWRAYR